MLVTSITTITIVVEVIVLLVNLSTTNMKIGLA